MNFTILHTIILPTLLHTQHVLTASKLLPSEPALEIFLMMQCLQFNQP